MYDKILGLTKFCTQIERTPRAFALFFENFVLRNFVTFDTPDKNFPLKKLANQIISSEEFFSLSEPVTCVVVGVSGSEQRAVLFFAPLPLFLV